jgi:hypothetical protein
MELLIDFVIGCLLSYGFLNSLSAVLSQWLLIDSKDLMVTLLKQMLTLEVDVSSLMDADLMLLLLLLVVLTYALVATLMLKKSCFLLCLPLVGLMSYQFFRQLLWSVAKTHYKYITNDL